MPGIPFEQRLKLKTLINPPYRGISLQNLAECIKIYHTSTSVFNIFAPAVIKNLEKYLAYALKSNQPSSLADNDILALIVDAHLRYGNRSDIEILAKERKLDVEKYDFTTSDAMGNPNSAGSIICAALKNALPRKVDSISVKVFQNEAIVVFPYKDDPHFYRLDPVALPNENDIYAESFWEASFSEDDCYRKNPDSHDENKSAVYKRFCAEARAESKFQHVWSNINASRDIYRQGCWVTFAQKITGRYVLQTKTKTIDIHVESAGRWSSGAAIVQCVLIRKIDGSAYWVLPLDAHRTRSYDMQTKQAMAAQDGDSKPAYVECDASYYEEKHLGLNAVDCVDIIVVHCQDEFDAEILKERFSAICSVRNFISISHLNTAILSLTLQIDIEKKIEKLCFVGRDIMAPFTYHEKSHNLSHVVQQQFTKIEEKSEKEVKEKTVITTDKSETLADLLMSYYGKIPTTLGKGFLDAAITEYVTASDTGGVSDQTMRLLDSPYLSSRMKSAVFTVLVHYAMQNKLYMSLLFPTTYAGYICGRSTLLVKTSLDSIFVLEASINKVFNKNKPDSGLASIMRQNCKLIDKIIAMLEYYLESTVFKYNESSAKGMLEIFRENHVRSNYIPAQLKNYLLNLLYLYSWDESFNRKNQGPAYAFNPQGLFCQVLVFGVKLCDEENKRIQAIKKSWPTACLLIAFQHANHDSELKDSILALFSTIISLAAPNDPFAVGCDANYPNNEKNAACVNNINPDKFLGTLFFRRHMPIKDDWVDAEKEVEPILNAAPQLALSNYITEAKALYRKPGLLR